MKIWNISRERCWNLSGNSLFFLVSFFIMGVALANNLAPNLFTWITIPPADAIIQQNQLARPEVKRSHFAQPHLDRMADAKSPNGADQITLNLFEDVVLTVVKDRLERRSLTDYSWFGHIIDAPHSQVILTVEQGSMAGNITVEDEHYGVKAIYQIRPAPGGLLEIREIDQSVFKEGNIDEGKSDYISVFTPNRDSLPSSQADDGSTIDVMVLYTDAAAAASSNIATEVQLGVDETNQSYINSGINQRIRLAHKAQVSYTETGYFCNHTPNDLERLQGKTDGYLDNIHAWRDTYAADIVSLWVESGDACGCGYFMSNVSTGFADNAFNVVRRDCATGYYSFGHEMGHNMGARHDWYVDKGTAPYAYAHGYVNTANKWRTIMAYNNKCSDIGISCSRIQYWSNPAVSYNGAPTGIAEGQTEAADNRKTLNNTAYTVANFRTSSSGSYTLTLAKAGTGNGTVSGGGTYAAGATVNLTATPDANSTFAGWSPSPCAASFTMPANNLVCTATFNLSQSAQPDLVIISVTSPGSGVAGGQITGALTVKNQGAQAAGSFWVGFYLSSDSTITSSDINTGWGCTISSLAAGASWGCSGTVGIPASVSPGTYYLGGYADPGNTVSESSETNNGGAATNPITITSSGSTYTLTVAKTGTGNGTVSGGGAYAAGATVTLTATPDANSTFSGWSPSPCAASFAMPANNLTCTATFNAISPSNLLLAGLNSNGQIYYTPDLSTWTQIAGQLNRLQMGDLNRDGKTDLVGLTTSGQIYYTINLSNWAQLPGTLSQIVMTDDLDGAAGWADLAGIASDGSIWYTGETAWTRIPGALSRIVAGDFDGNGRSDLAGVASNGSIWYTTDLNAWTQIPGGLSQMVAGDLNGDGQADLAGVASNGSIWYTTDLNTWTQIPGGLSQLRAIDLDGDGQADLAGLASNGTIWYTTNLSTWTNIPGQLAMLVGD